MGDLKQLVTRHVRETLQLAKDNWSRGEPGRETPPQLVLATYLGWMAALFLKMAGGSWDVAWHFKWLRFDTEPPHWVNGAGTLLVVVLVIVHTYTGCAVDRIGLRFMQVGTGMFLVAIPIDLINHRLNGLDITSWSASHGILYTGTALMVIGVLRGWYVSSPPMFARWRNLVLFGFWLFLLEDVWFPEQHQEYGVLGLAAWQRGAPDAEPELLQFAADQIGRPVDYEAVKSFTLPVADWLYPVWALVAAGLVILVARKVIGWKWAATGLAAGYILGRAVLWPLLWAFDFPISSVPFWFIGAAIGIDLAFRFELPALVRPLAGAVLATGLGYAALAGQIALGIATPPSTLLGSAPFAAALLALVWYGTVWFSEYRGRAITRSKVEGGLSPA